MLGNVGLRFADAAQEQRYQTFLQSRCYPYCQWVLALSIVTWAAYGIWDLAAGIEANLSNRFRYMVAIPVLATLFALSFLPAARKVWRTFFTVYCTIATLLAAMQCLLISDAISFFGYTSGTPALNFAVVAVFAVGVLPVPFLTSCIIGAIIFLLWVAYSLLFAVGVPIAVKGAYAFNLFSVVFGALILSAIRDLLLRQRFVDFELLQQRHDDVRSKLLSYISLDALQGADHNRIVAHSFGEVTVLFADIVGFTALAERLAPRHLLELLSDIFTRFDAIVKLHRVAKVKTIGDAYMAIAGTQDESDSSHARRIADVALDMLQAVEDVSTGSGFPVKIRIGINTGSLIGGVIDQERRLFDYWGRTVNLASRLESSSLPNRIHISEASFWRLRNDYMCEERGTQDMKELGQVPTYFLVRRITSEGAPTGRSVEAS